MASGNLVGVSEKDVEDIIRWRQILYSGDP